jgi:hypothetical protein
MTNNRIRVLIAIVAAAGILQLIPTTTPNPPIIKARAIGAALEIPPNIQKLMDKACASCHSNETVWPWYAKIAPVSFLTSHDVNRGRNAMNFSEWTGPASRGPAVAIGILAAACGDLQTGRMPLAPYRMMHPEARLSQDEIGQFCRWTATATREIIAERRSAVPKKRATD